MERGATATGAREFHLLPLALAGGWAEAPAFTHALSEPFALLRGHVRAALLHATAEIGARGTTPSRSTEENPTQQQESAPDGDKYQKRQNRQRSNENQSLPSLTHVQSLMLS